jgi:hypothetical protein
MTWLVGCFGNNWFYGIYEGLLTFAATGVSKIIGRAYILGVTQVSALKGCWNRRLVSCLKPVLANEVISF